MKGEWMRQPDTGVAVVFVHGVLSSGEACWKHPNGTYWPSLLCQDPADGHGVYVFTYRTDIFSGTYRVGDIVDALKEHMRLDGVLRCRTVIFVAHSLGGIVVRKLLVERTADFKNADVAVGLFLVASPSLGSDYANLLAPLARVMSHAQADALRFSQTNAWLMDLDKEFTNLKEARTLHLFGKELVEDVFVVFSGLIRKQVVQPFAGAKYFGEPYKVPKSDHFSIAKPESAEAIQHRLLRLFIEERPQPGDGKLPIEQELSKQLRIRIAACTEAQVPFRTYHKLAAIFATPGDFGATCFEAAGKGTASRMKEWLRETLMAQEAAERGHGGRPHSLDEDPTLAKAVEIAWLERSTEVDERHLLLAILADRESGTTEEIVRSLTEQGMSKVQAAAQIGRPVRARLKSRLPKLIRPEGLS